MLAEAGLPRPETQIPVNDGWRLVGVLDMGWERYKVGVEYDGEHHRTDRRQYARDQWRLRRLDELGWIVVRVIVGDKPEDVVRRVRAALGRRGCREI